jgi:hypothetical protein
MSFGYLQSHQDEYKIVWSYAPFGEEMCKIVKFDIWGLAYWTPKDPWVFWYKTTQNYPFWKKDL